MTADTLAQVMSERYCSSLAQEGTGRQDHVSELEGDIWPQQN